jgi:hypothetical protein
MLLPKIMIIIEAGKRIIEISLIAFLISVFRRI